MAQGRSTQFISTIKWIRTSRLSIKNSRLQRTEHVVGRLEEGREALDELRLGEGVGGLLDAARILGSAAGVHAPQILAARLPCQISYDMCFNQKEFWQYSLLHDV